MALDGRQVWQAAAVEPAERERLEEIAHTLDVCIEDIIRAGLQETAAFLSIAKLDLVARLHQVSDRELDQLTRAAGRRKRVVRIEPARSRRRRARA